MKLRKTIAATGATLAAGLQAAGLIEFLVVTGLCLAIAGATIVIGIKVAKKAGLIGDKYKARIIQETEDGAEQVLTNRSTVTNIYLLPHRRLSLQLHTDGTNNVRLMWSPTLNGTNWQPLVSACVDGLTATMSTTQSSAFFRLEVAP